MTCVTEYYFLRGALICLLPSSHAQPKASRAPCFSAGSMIIDIGFPTHWSWQRFPNTSVMAAVTIADR